MRPRSAFGRFQDRPMLGKDFESAVILQVRRLARNSVDDDLAAGRNADDRGSRRIEKAPFDSLWRRPPRDRRIVHPVSPWFVEIGGPLREARSAFAARPHRLPIASPLEGVGSP